MKKQVQTIVLHYTLLPADAIIESVKQFWREQEEWKNPGVHYIVSATGKVEELFLEPSKRGKGKGKGNSVHLSFVMPDITSKKSIGARVDKQISAFKKKVQELKLLDPKQGVRLELLIGPSESLPCLQPS
jgi:hypothetical protein